MPWLLCYSHKHEVFDSKRTGMYVLCRDSEFEIRSLEI